MVDAARLLPPIRWWQRRARSRFSDQIMPRLFWMANPMKSKRIALGIAQEQVPNPNGAAAADFDRFEPAGCLSSKKKFAFSFLL
jgi:hypothetical protein